MPFTAIHRMARNVLRRIRRLTHPHRCADCGVMLFQNGLESYDGMCVRCHAYSEHRMHQCNFCHGYFSSAHSMLPDWVACDDCYTARTVENTEPAPRHSGNINIEVVSAVTPEQVANIARAMSDVGTSAREAMQGMGRVVSAFSREFEGRPLLGCTESGTHQWHIFEDVATNEIVHHCETCGAQERHDRDDWQLLERQTVGGETEQVLAPRGGTVSGRASARGPRRSQLPRVRGQARTPPEPPTGSPPPAQKGTTQSNPFVQLGAPRKRPINLDD